MEASQIEEIADNSDVRSHQSSDRTSLDPNLPRLVYKPRKKQTTFVSLDSDEDSSDSVRIDYMKSDDPIVISSSQSDSEQDQTSPKFEGRLPIFSSRENALTAPEIFRICFGEFQDKYLCKEKPVSVRSNAVFIVDLESIDVRSLYADDNGVWTVSTPRRYFRVLMEDGRVNDISSAHKDDYTHLLKRQYGKHHATFVEKGVHFQRIISTVQNKKGQRCRYAVVQYILRDGFETDIVVHPHGNTRKTKRPFFKTDPTLLEKIKEEPLESKPKRVYTQLMEDSGGPLYSTSASTEPRNVQQIYSIRKALKESQKEDDFTHLLSQVKESAFVHDLTIDSKSVQYVLASEKQLKDLEVFCTNPEKYSVFCIDSTYNVGNFYVTNTCFQNFKIVHADGKYRGRHPYEIGPTFVHTERGTNNFVGFFSSLVRMNPCLKNIQAIGSDGDEAVMNSILICFQDAKNLLCSAHKKDDIQRKLKKDFLVRDAVVSHILADVFGRAQGAISEQGLIDSMSNTEFDGKLMRLNATWECLCPGFHEWFLRYEAESFKLHLIRGITQSAHLEGHFTNNQTESVNNNVKDWLGRKGNLSFAVANTRIEELVTSQQQEFEISVYGNGSYEMAESFDALREKRHMWNSMSAEERRNALQKFWKSPLIVARPRQSSPFSPTFADKVPLQHDTMRDESSTEKHYEKKLSMNVENCELSGCSQDLLKDIWGKAEKLIKSPDGIVNAPGFDGVFVQHYDEKSTRNVPPQLITWTKAGKFVCGCCLYTSVKVCQHTIAASESKGKLRDFLQWRKKQSVSTGMTDLVMTGIASGRKGKVLKPRKGGRTPLDKETPAVQQEREPLIESTATDETLSALEDAEKDTPFELIYLFQTKAQSCYGCSVKFNRPKETNSLIIRKHCEREFTVQGVKKTRYQYAYFHMKSKCVLQKCPQYEQKSLKVSDESKGILPTKVQDKLKKMGISVE